MDAKAKRSFVREKASENAGDHRGAKILWSRHAITEMVVDRLVRPEVERALQECEVIEDYAHLRRALPD